MHRLLPLIMLLAACAGEPDPATDFVLTAPQIQRRVAGHTLMGVTASGQRVYLTLERNFILRYIGADEEFGTWYTKGDDLCLVFHGEAPRCAKVRQTAVTRFVIGDTSMQYWDGATSPVSVSPSPARGPFDKNSGGPG